MNRVLLIVVGVIVLIGVGGVIFMLSAGPKNTPAPTATSTSPFGTANQGGTVPANNTTTRTVVTTDGTSISIPDITANHPADTEVSGTYYHVTENQNHDQLYPNFNIVYGTDSTFSIGLSSEPLGQARLAAENKLRELTGLTNAQLCKMSVTVMTIPSVNETYAGQELGLSFCPGATKLP